MAKGYFIAGTDTSVGKSWCSAALMMKLKQQGLTVAGMKPVASGCVQTAEGLRNDDALLLQAHSSVSIPYETINPFAYAPPISPHIAAKQASRPIQIDIIRDDFLRISKQIDQVIVEGVGGWRVPLNETETVADLAKALGLPVILVVGLRLGCINHALLTAEAILNNGCELAGWIANSLENDMPEQTAVIETLAARLETPLLGVVPYMAEHSVEEIAAALTLPSQ